MISKQLGRPDHFDQCWAAFKRASGAAIEVGRIRVVNGKWSGWVNIEFIAALIREGDPTISLSTSRRYAKFIYIVTSGKTDLDPADQKFMRKLGPLVARLKL